MLRLRGIPRLEGIPGLTSFRLPAGSLRGAASEAVRLLKRPRALKRLASGMSASLHTRGLVLWVATLVTGILCVSQHVYSTKLAEQITELRGSRADLEAEIGFLEMERSRLSSRERIESYASQRLGMRYPEAHEVVRLGEGTRFDANRWDDELVEVSDLAVSDG